MPYDLARLGLAMRQRRERFGLSQKLIETLGGLSDAEQSKFETGMRSEDGRSVRANTWLKIERGLGWREGSAERVAQGGEPDEVDGWPWQQIMMTRDAIMHGETPSGLDAPTLRRVLELAARSEQEGLIASLPPPPRSMAERDVETLYAQRRRSIRDQIRVLRRELRAIGGDDEIDL